MINLGSARTYFLMKLGPGIAWSISRKLVFHHETKVHSKIFHHKTGVNRKTFHCLYSLDRKVSSSGWNVGSLADDAGFMGSLHSKTSKWGSCPWFISSGNSQIQCNVFYEIHVYVSWSKELSLLIQLLVLCTVELLKGSWLPLRGSWAYIEQNRN